MGPPKCNSIIWCSKIEEWAGHRRSRTRRAVALGSALLLNVLPPGSCSVCRLWKVLKFGTQAPTWCWQAMLLYAHVSSVPVCMPVSKQTSISVRVGAHCCRLQASLHLVLLRAFALPTLHFLRGPYVLRQSSFSLAWQQETEA